jgi:plasmid stability protein
VRTTLTLEKDVAARLKAEAQRSGRSFKDVVNECLRQGLAHRPSARSLERFSVKPRDFGGVRPGIALDNIGELLQQVEGPDRT